MSSSISSSKRTIDIVDANPKGPKSNPTDYSFTLTSSMVTTGSNLYGFDTIETYTMTPRGDGLQKESNKIYIRPKKRITGNLSPSKPAVVDITEQNSKSSVETQDDSDWEEIDNN